jgi:hypothetical protein
MKRAEKSQSDKQLAEALQLFINKALQGTPNNKDFAALVGQITHKNNKPNPDGLVRWYRVRKTDIFYIINV